MRNSSEDAAIVDLPYRVTLLSQGKELATSTTNESLYTAPGETHPVVFNWTQDAVKEEPDAATVKFYPQPNTYVKPSPMLSSGLWKYESQRLQPQSNTASVVLATDATYAGIEKAGVAHTYIMVHDGDIHGPIIGAWGQVSVSVQVLYTPGQTLPLNLHTFGYRRQMIDSKNNTVQLPADTTVEIYTETLRGRGL